MAWIYQRPDSKRWWVGFRRNGRQFLQSTGTSNKAEAEKKLRHFQTIEDLERDGRLTESFIEALTGKKQAGITLRAAATDFLAEAKGSTAERTFERYEAIVKAFLQSVSADEARPLLRDVTPDDVRAYLTKRRAATSASTANLEKKILSSLFRWCIKNQILKENPVFPVKSFKDSGKEAEARRAFDLNEIKTLHAKAPDDFWRYMVVGGFYSGLRMGDLILLRVGEIDFTENVLRLTTGKTNRRMIIPMAKPLRAMLAKLTESIPVNNPNRYLWPGQAKRYQEHDAKPFSAEFYKLVMVPAGLAVKRTHAKQKNGRAAKREVGGASFHCMRHSFVTFLKSTGSNPAIARELAGHSSDMVNNLYTHLPQSTLSDAINKLPEVAV